MKRMIAAFALMALAIAIAIYIAMAPMASPTAQGSVNALLASFDGLVDHIEAGVGRSTGALIAIGVGLVLALAIGLAPSRRRRADEDAFFVPEDVPEPGDYVPSPGAAALEEPIAEPVHEASSPEPAPEPWVEPALFGEPQAEPHPEPVQADLLAQSAYPEPEAPPAPFLVAPLALTRKVREPERNWFGDTSWLGGLPRLGANPWPRDTAGIALPFLAQIDLAEVAAVRPGLSLPTRGALAFFLGDGGIVPVAPPEPGTSSEFTEPPQDLPPAFDEGGPLFPQRASRLTRWLFPFWPVELSATAPGAEDADTRDHPFYAVGVGEPVDTLWWHSAQHFADRLRDALEQADTPIAAHRERLRQMREALARIENDPDADPYERDDARDDIESLEVELAQIEEQRRSLPEMLAAMEGFVEGREPWSVMSPEEREILRDLVPETHERYGELIGSAIPASLAELATISLRAAISGPPEAIAAIPPATLTRINGEYRLPIEARHSLFTASPDSDEIVLVELAWDDMIEWCWPEEGRFQLRIAPADAAAGRWDRARALFVQG